MHLYCWIFAAVLNLNFLRASQFNELLTNNVFVVVYVTVYSLYGLIDFMHSSVTLVTFPPSRSDL